MCAARHESLKEYDSRRDFAKTPEPKGGRAKKGGRGFVVQKHDARALHYDFRLEHDGVLLSWAVTRGPSLDPADKRLAVRTEDHPLDYGGFEGVIPKGQYGGGTVMLWDRGAWEPEGDPEKGLEEGKLKFTLHGERMTGGWALIRMKPRKKEKRENWLLIKERDDAASDNGDDLTGDARTSVETGRSMSEIARGGDTWRSDRPAGKNKSAPGGKTQKKQASKSSGKVRLPAFVKPQLATLVDAVPPGRDWLHEIKYDGYRAIASVANGSVIIRTRNGLDWTDRFPSLADALSGLPVKSAQLDGEIAVADAEGRTDFGALQNAISEGAGDMGYYVFDILSLDGENLKAKPLKARKKRLEKLLKALPEKSPLVYSDHIEGKGEAMYEHACDIALEGIISKRADAAYRSGRSKAWLKVKCGMGQEFVIIGWRPSDKAGRPFSSILLALREGEGLRYCGRVGSGFGDDDFDRVWPELEKRVRKTAPARGIPRVVERDAKFVTPELVAEIAFRGWTREGYVRQGSFKGLRSDKPAGAIVKERKMPAPAKTKKSAKKAGNKPGKEGGGEVEIEGVRVTHPDRMLFPSQGVTKRDLIDHYLSVADEMLPHVVDRPLSLVRCPDGRGGECFYQKHASPGFPDAFHAVEIKEKSGSGEYLYIRDTAGLVAAVQMGVLEIHIWGARRDRLERPDRFVLDLDPDEGIGFDAVRKAASEMRERLDGLDLESFLLATGGKGLHVVVPLERRHEWEDHKTFAEAMARMMAGDSPDRYVATMSKAKRKGKIFIDYLRNERGSTAIAPFSSRAREGAPAAFPVPWSALGKLKDARSVHVGEAAGRLKRYKTHPWSGYHDVRQSLPMKTLETLKG